MLRLLFAAVLLSVAAPSVLAQALTLSVAAPHQDFAVGEEIVFRVSGGSAGTLSYELSYAEEVGPIETGTLDYDGAAGEVRYRATVACFLYLRVTLGGEEADIGVAVGRDDIRPLTTLPDDFDAFWAEQRAALDAVPIDLRREQERETDYSTSYRFSAGSVEGRRLYGYLTVPKGGGPKPAALRLPPYGSRGPGGPAHRFAEKGNLISLTINIHDAPAGERAEDAYEPNDLRARETVYYRYAVLAALRAIDVIAAMPEWDQTTVVAYGKSQGGGLALLTAAIDPRVTHLYQAVAALSQHHGAVTGQASGFPYFLDKARDRHEEPGFELARTAVRYYDAALAAARFDGPSVHFVNYKDPICPPATHYAGTNAMRGPKVILHDLDLDHGTPDEFEEYFLAWVRTHIPGTRTPPFFYEDGDVGYDVGAGEDQRVETTAQLAGRATFDNAALGAGTTVAWRQESGPGIAAFAQPTALNTAATFSAPGTYRLRLQVTVPYPGDDRKFYLLTDDVEVTVGNGTSSVVGLASVRDVRVWPNPTQADVEVELTAATADELHVGLYDILGRETGAQTHTEIAVGQRLRQTVPTTGLPAGTYFLVLRGAAGIHRTAVVVE